jgi:hypothetical protein
MRWKGKGEWRVESLQVGRFEGWKAESRKMAVKYGSCKTTREFNLWESEI